MRWLMIMFFNNILILSPHPDDECIGCGGLIGWAKKNRIKTSILYFSYVLLGVDSVRQANGNFTTTEDRIEEIKKVSEFGNLSYTLPPKGWFYDYRLNNELIKYIENEIEYIKPDLVCIPFQNSYNQDHRKVFDAAYAALRPIPKNMKHFVNCVLEYEEPYSWTVGENFKPTFYLPMTKEDCNFKLELIKLHNSQMRSDPYSRSVENLERISKIRGAEIGIKYAEAYKIHRMVQNV